MGLKSRVTYDWDGDHEWNEVLIGDKWVSRDITTRKGSSRKEQRRPGLASTIGCWRLMMADTYDTESKPGERWLRKRLSYWTFWFKGSLLK
jgi:hypothetical protein